MLAGGRQKKRAPNGTRLPPRLPVHSVWMQNLFGGVRQSKASGCRTGAFSIAGTNVLATRAIGLAGRNRTWATGLAVAHASSITLLAVLVNDWRVLQQAAVLPINRLAVSNHLTTATTWL